MAFDQNWEQDLLDLADLDQEYGLLARTFAEVKRAAAPATAAVQNYVAGKVVERFQGAYDAYARSYDHADPANIARAQGNPRANQPLPRDLYFQKNPAAYLDVLSQKMDLSLGGLAEQEQPKGSFTPADLFPTAFETETVGYAMRWLTRSELPGILTAIAKPIYGEAPYRRDPVTGKALLDENGSRIPSGERPPLIGHAASNFPADEINAAWEAGFRSIHLFKPGGTDGNNFTVWFQAHVQKGIERFRDTEREWRASSVPWSVISGGNEEGDEFEGGGFSIDGNTGEYGDRGNTLLDTAAGIGSASRFSGPSIRPERGVFGVDWSTEGGKRRTVSDFVNHILGGHPEDVFSPYSKQNVQTGRVEVDKDFDPGHGRAKASAWEYGLDPLNVQAFGVDPDSPAGRAGMQEGAFISSLQRLFEHPDLASMVDEMFYDTELNLPVIQPNQSGEMTEQILNISLGGQSGRGLADGQEDTVHWMDRLADLVDRDNGRTVTSMRATWRMDDHGKPIYQPLAPRVSRAASGNGIMTGLFTTSERYASGMFEDEAGWHIAPMQEGMDETYTVPVTITGDAIRRFKPLVEQFDARWREFRSIYDTKSRQAYESVLGQYKRAFRETGKMPQVPFWEQVRNRVLSSLPRDIPQPGTPLYNQWRAGSAMLEEIREFEKSSDPAGSGDFDFYERTIEQWDAWASGLEYYKNPDGMGKINPRRMDLAQRHVSNAGNDLVTQRRLRAQGLLDRLQNRNADPGGYDLIHKLHAVGPNGELVHRYPVMAAQRHSGPVQAAPGRSPVDARPLDMQAELDFAAYSSISNNNALSSFPLGSMNEDRWEGELRGKNVPTYEGMPDPSGLMSRWEDRETGANELDDSILGGDAGTEAYLTTPRSQTTHTRANFPQTGMTYNLVTHEPILPERRLYTAPRVDPVMAEKYHYLNSIEDANANSDDPVIALRQKSRLGNGEDREMDEASAEYAAGEEAAQYRNAFRVLPDPLAEDASLSAIVSDAGNKGGFLRGSKVNWGALFTTFARGDKQNATYGTFHALKNADQQAERMSREIEANISALKGAGKKRAVMLTRLGERDHQGRGPELAQEMANNVRSGKRHAEFYRQALQEIDREYHLNLAWQPGKEAELYDQLEELKSSNLEAYNRVSSIYASQAEQLKLSRQYVAAALTVPSNPVPTGSTPAPQRGSSHRNQAPGGPSMAKYSLEDRFEMRRGRGVVDPVTGEFDPMMLENTPVSAQLAARNGGGVAGRLSQEQARILYHHLDDSKIARQVGWFMENEYQSGSRSMFNFIVREDASDDFLSGLQALAEGEFASHNIKFGKLQDIEDADLPKGFRKIGGYLYDQNAGAEYADIEEEEISGFEEDFVPGEPPEAPPADGASAGGGNGSRPPGDTTAAPPPAGRGGNGRRSGRPKPNTNPADFPMTPGAEGWKMTFGRYDTKTRSSKQVTAWGRRNDAGELGWYVQNDEGVLEPLRVNRGSGKIYDENDQLIYDVDYRARQRWEGMNAPVSAPREASGRAGNAAPEPARPEVIRDPAQWAQIQPQAGWSIQDRNGYNTRWLFAEADPDNPGQMIWQTSARGGAIPQRVNAPGWGIMQDGEGNVVADVKQDAFERWANDQGRDLAAENRRIQEENHIQWEQERAQRQAEAQPRTPPAARFNARNTAFSRFNNAMGTLSGRFQSRFLAQHPPSEFGEASIGERTKIATMNEYYMGVAGIWNSFVDRAPSSVDEVTAAISDLTGEDGEQVQTAAQDLFDDFEQAKKQHRPLYREDPTRRSEPQLPARMARDDVGRGPLGFRSYAQSLVEDIGLKDIDGFRSPSLGEPWEYSFTDEKGENRWIPRLAKEAAGTGFGQEHQVVTADENQIAQGMNWAKGAFAKSIQGDLPNTPDAILATVKERMYKAISDQMQTEIKQSTEHGMSSTEAGKGAQIIRQLADHFQTKILDKVSKALGVTEGETSYLATEGSRYNTDIKSLDELQNLVNRSPAVAKALSNRSLNEALAGDQMIVFDEEDRSYRVGGQSGGVSGAGNMRGMPWSARMMFGRNAAGAFMYGAYLLNREWQMAAGGTLAAANQYGMGMADYAPLLYSGQDLAGTDMGYAYRQQAGQSFMGQAAYSAFGAYMDLPYRLSQSGNMGAARLLQSAGIGVGIATGGAIGGSMLATSGLPMMVAAGSTLATGGLLMGGSLLAAAAGMEIYNSHFKPENAPDVTFSTPIKNFDMDSARARAAENRANTLFGRTYEEYLNIAKSRPSGADRSISEEDWWEKKYDASMQTYGDRLADEQLLPYASEEDRVLWANLEMNRKTADLGKQVKIISGKTLEDETSLKKAMAIQKRFTGSPDAMLLGQVSDIAASLGLTSDEDLQQGAAYASQMGYIENTPDFERAMYEYALEKDPYKRAENQLQGANVSRLGSQLQAAMGSSAGFEGLGESIILRYGLNAARTGALQGMASGLEQQGAELSPLEWEQMAAIARDNAPVVTNTIGNALEQFYGAGMSQAQTQQIGGMLSGVGFTNQEASRYSQMMGGDLGAYSFQAWKSGQMENAFFDRAGRPITQSNGAIGMQVYNHWAPKVGLPAMTTAQFLGIRDTPTALQSQIISSYEQGGWWSVQKLANQKSYEASMASIGVQLKGIALSENFYWGSNAGGTWDNPAEHSAWGIEYRQLALQDASTRAGFQEQWTRMNTQNAYSIRREDNQLQRMNASQSFQNWQWSYSYNQFQQSQMWAREDWQLQDTTRGLNFGWQMEDLNEAIRFASGRERRQLVRQRDRAALSHNLEGEQIDTQRDRQKELWAQQDEQYQKQRQYNLELQRLDQESFALNKEQREAFFKLDVQAYERRVKEYEEEKKLQDELRELQRKFQYDQLQLQKEAAGAQAAAAAAQKAFNDAQAEGMKNWDTMMGTLQETFKYDSAFRIAEATREMMAMMDRVDVFKINKLIELIRTIGTTAVSSNQRYGGERDE